MTRQKQAKASSKAEADPSLRLRMTRQEQPKASAEAGPSLRLRMTRRGIEVRMVLLISVWRLLL
jgi:hypothetical protein